MPVGPIVLQAEYIGNVFSVTVTVDGIDYHDTLTPSDYKDFCQQVDHGIWLGGLSFPYRQFDRRDVTIRCKRGIAQYFRSVLEISGHR